ncbi:MAG TPA: hypothetical protein GX529_08245 [Firmicutes bacterium]|nr:hypothetical protein [Candidatus Fermentithermobacillaceae bacterium]
MKKWGIAFGAGGIFGFVHIGVLEALEARGLKPGFIAGTSAGAIVGGLWASGLKPGTIRNEMQSLVLDEKIQCLPKNYQIPVEDYSLDLASAMGIQGLLDPSWIEPIVDRLTSNKMMSDIETPLSIVSCDLFTGDTVVFTNCLSDSELSPGTEPDAYPGRKRRYITGAALSTAVMSSSSMPGIFTPRKLGNNQLVDGGVKEMVPAYEVRRMGAEEVLSVDLGSYIDRPQQAKGIYSVLARSFNLATRGATLNHLKKHTSMTLRPRVWEVGFPTPSKIKALVESGRICAEKHMDRWLDLICRQENR